MKNIVSNIKINHLITILSILLSLYKYLTRVTKENIKELTDKWCDLVTECNNSEEITKMFSHNGNLIETSSNVKCKHRDIKLYFDYFVNLPNIQILSKEYNIYKVTDNVFINSALITWQWDGLEKPVVARITFIFRDRKIFQCHSSNLLELNKKD